jgi:dipeptidase D
MPQNAKHLEEILSYEPRAVWRYFAGLAAVPRPSKMEQRVREHVQRVATAAGLKVRADSINLVIEVPPTPGHEKAPITVLQAHLDMVGEKNSDVAHDFDRDPIVLVPDQDPKTGEPIVRAAGTTLGADNGIGVSLALVFPLDRLPALKLAGE